MNGLIAPAADGFFPTWIVPDYHDWVAGMTGVENGVGDFARAAVIERFEKNQV